jgi:FlaA1/EpsC-like NDP-sugar epimerase
LSNLCFYLLFNVHRSLWDYVSVDEAVRLGLAFLLGNGLLFGVYLNHWLGMYHSLPLEAGLIAIVVCSGVRVAYRLQRRSRLNDKKEALRTLIVGAGDGGFHALREIRVNKDYPYLVVGFVDDDVTKLYKTVGGIKVLGGLEDLEGLLVKLQVQQVVYAIPSVNGLRRKYVIDVCSKLNVGVKIFMMGQNSPDHVNHIRDVSIDDLLGRGQVNLNTAEISNEIMGKVICVTGAGGSIGSELVRQLLRFSPKCLVLVDTYENNMYDLQQELLIEERLLKVERKCELVCRIASVRDYEAVKQIFDEYDIELVFHAAAHKHVPLMEVSPAQAIKNNVVGTRHVIEACIDHGVKKFILVSSDKAVRPTNVMGATKRMCELLVQGYKNNGVTKLAAVRFGNVLGSNGSVIPLFNKQIKVGGPITITDPEIIRYFMTIPEAAQLIVQAGVYADNGEVFVLDMGQPVKIVDLADKLIRLNGLEPHRDIKIVYTGLRPGEKLYEELLMDDKHSKTKNDLIFIAQPELISKELVIDRYHELLGVLDQEPHVIKAKLMEVIEV